MILLLDNYDSFTYNIYQYITQLGHTAKVIRNDAATVESIAGAGFSAVIISPGPGRPSDAGITLDLIRRMAGIVPVLGICLGHQAIAEAFGGQVVAAPQPVHGKTSPIYHNGEDLFDQMPQPFAAGRYHSLVADREKLPACLTVTAQTEDGIIMAIKHNRFAVEGIQFHPESVLTQGGIKLIENFLSKL